MHCNNLNCFQKLVFLYLLSISVKSSYILNNTYIRDGVLNYLEVRLSIKTRQKLAKISILRNGLIYELKIK